MPDRPVAERIGVFFRQNVYHFLPYLVHSTVKSLNLKLSKSLQSNLKKRKVFHTRLWFTSNFLIGMRIISNCIHRTQKDCRVCFLLSRFLYHGFGRFPSQSFARSILTSYAFEFRFSDNHYGKICGTSFCLFFFVSQQRSFKKVAAFRVQYYDFYEKILNTCYRLVTIQQTIDVLPRKSFPIRLGMGNWHELFVMIILMSVYDLNFAWKDQPDELNFRLNEHEWAIRGRPGAFWTRQTPRRDTVHDLWSGYGIHRRAAIGMFVF